MTDTPAPPAEAVEIAARALSQREWTATGDDPQSRWVDRPDFFSATTALTALAAAGWTLTPPGKP